MQDREILSIQSNGSKVCIVDNMLFIGSDDNDSEQPDVVIQYNNDKLLIDGWEVTPAMIKVINMYIDRDL